MAVYTTQLRSICESVTGHTTAESFSKVDEIIADARELIFDFDYPIFDTAYKPELEEKILHHFYLREIGAETYGQFKLFLSQRMREIMPLYNHMYNAQLMLLDIDPLSDVDYERKTTHAGVDTDGESGTTKISGSDTNSGDDINTQTYTNYKTEFTPGAKYITKRSDTPQGGINGVENDTYLSEVTISQGSGNGKDTTNVNGEIKNTLKNGKKVTSDHTTTHGKTLTKTYGSTITEQIKGKMGTSDFTQLLTNWKNAFDNIDAMIMDDLEVCFMNIY